MNSKKYLFVLLIIFSRLSHADDITENIETLHPSIEKIYLCGNWEHQDELGSFRIIEGFASGHSELFVQWRHEADSNQTNGLRVKAIPEIKSTVAITSGSSFSENAEYFTDIKCTKHRDHWVLSALVENGNVEQSAKHKYKLEVELFDQPGRFERKTIKK